MAKLWNKPIEEQLTDNQKAYINTFWQDKFDSLITRRKNDEAWLWKQVDESQSSWWSDNVAVASVSAQGNQQENDYLKMIQQLQQQINELKEKDANPHEEARKMYDWPRKYSYKMWEGMPVLWYTSYSINPQYWLTYVDQKTRNLMSNHGLRIACFNLETWEIEKREIEVWHFNGHFTRSDKLFCEVKSNGSQVTGYVFEVDWKKFEVLPQVIN